MGWDTQLKDEPALLLTYERSWRYRVDDLPFGLVMFATPHLGAAVGNVFVYVNAGATLTLGWNLGDDYGPPRIQPSTPGSGYFEQKDGVGLYAFAGVDARAVARNIFLDGNTWADSRSVDKNTFVGDAQVGLALTFQSASRVSPSFPALSHGEPLRLLDSQFKFFRVTAVFIITFVCFISESWVGH